MNRIETLDERMNAQLAQFYELLKDANERVNLTAIVEENDVWLKHFADSLAGLSVFPDGARILDEGCGAGFPSIPLKIANPTLRFTLVDSVNKKVAFVQDAIAKLGLAGIEAIHARIEQIPERNYDFVVARAVAKLSTLAEYALPFLRVGGKLVAYKAADIDEELRESERALITLGGRVAEIREVKLADDLIRKLVVVEKMRPTPAKFPRPRNLPRTQPL